MHFFYKIKWAGLRILFYLSTILTLFSFGLTLYFFAPITSFIFFDDFAFWRHLKYFPKLYLSLFAFLKMAALSPKTGYSVRMPLWAPPRLTPDPSVARLATNWPAQNGHCNGCYSCCDTFGCPLLHEGKCLCYSSFYWRYFNCGRFPEEPKQLAFYACPKWSLISTNSCARS